MMMKNGVTTCSSVLNSKFAFYIENELQQMYVIYCASSRRWLRDRIKDWPPLLTTLLWQYNRWELQLNEWIYYLVIDKKDELLLLQSHSQLLQRIYWHKKWVHWKYAPFTSMALALNVSIFCWYWKGLHTLTTLKTFLYILEKVIQLPSQQN